MGIEDYMQEIGLLGEPVGKHPEPSPRRVQEATQEEVNFTTADQIIEEQQMAPTQNEEISIVAIFDKETRHYNKFVMSNATGRYDDDGKEIHDSTKPFGTVFIPKSVDYSKVKLVFS